MSSFLGVALFGAIGCVLRYAIDRALVGAWSNFPLSTLLINIVGSVAIGCISVWGVEKEMLSPALSAGLMVGLLGGFTTFSAFSLQTVHMLERNEFMLATLYTVMSVVASVGGAAMGLRLARLL